MITMITMATRSQKEPHLETAAAINRGILSTTATIDSIFGELSDYGDGLRYGDADMGKSKGLRACDGCRLRKRKCDGVQPYCTNCLKSITRDEDGNPVCTYNIEAKKRGPRPGYKDRMLQRLERLENILHPLVETPETVLPSEGSSKYTTNNVGIASTLTPPSKTRRKPIQQRVLDLFDAVDPISKANSTSPIAAVPPTALDSNAMLLADHEPRPTSGLSLLLPEASLNSSHIASTETGHPTQSLFPPFLVQQLQPTLVSLLSHPVQSSADRSMGHDDLQPINLSVNSASNTIKPIHANILGGMDELSGMDNLNGILGFDDHFQQQQSQLAIDAVLSVTNNDAMICSSTPQWTTPDTIPNINHSALLQMQTSSAEIGLANFYIDNPNFYSSMSYPSILDPFPCVFNGTLGHPLSLGNVSFLGYSAQQQNALASLESHLLMLGLNYNLVVPLSKAQSSSLFSAQNSTKILPNALRDALIATGVFFSSHVDLFSPLLGQPPVLNRDSCSKSEARISIARIYIQRSRTALNAAITPAGSTHLDGVDPTVNPKSVNGTPIEPLDECDAVRTMLILATISFGLGDGGDSMQLVADAYRLAQKAKMYEASLVRAEGSQYKQPLTVDSLVISVPRMVMANPKNLKLTPLEKFDRRVLWGSCLILDTYCAMASGYQSGIDDGDYPGLVAAFEYTDLLPHLKFQDPSSHKHPPQPPLAEHTIWENTPLAVMFDNVSEMSRTSMLINAVTGEFESLIHLTFIMRRIMRYVRSHMASPSVEFCPPNLDQNPEKMQNTSNIPQLSIGSTASLHNSLLEWYDGFPERFRAFPSLESFARGVHSAELDQYRDWTYNIYIVECILTFLSAFSYLHLPLLTGPDAHVKLYRLRLSGKAHTSASTSQNYISKESPADDLQSLWSSQQVLLACFRALTYMIRRLYTPTTPSQSPFRSQDYDLDRLQYCQQQLLPSDIPSPALCWTIHSLNIYIISSAGLMAGRSHINTNDGNASHLESVVRLVNTLVLPSLERISKVWPMAQLYQYKLGTLLKGGTAEEWAAEAISYTQL
ncbi:hypothetical protein BASA50_003008 [Batrachochytrium salamandrivorans]|uniref:Zn(2)-C6 fungal-type domain-containing protein n=1 Tax=Batrachochytrium salamandrivorans TaxID=1357716 RepID=A0ABQ8FJT5_9FUNG|nr:hypothetical protein BASA62_009009 [Batrachochytrium salamandrivorans]KAH6599497.1 hypothetical protein BASA50_003008 [Batrachochytrium salamandrivorans]KAH9267758.1 hypothetical protein BASA84_000541 [Batrachochytrium salamandrivorans]